MSNATPKPRTRAKAPAPTSEAPSTEIARIDERVDVFCSFTELRLIEGVTPHPRNPNSHSVEQITLLSRIIEAQGWRNPIVVSQRSGFVTKGHGRLAAAHMLGLTKVPVDLQAYPNEAAEVADMIADNRIAELSVMNLEEVKALIDDAVLPGGFDMELTGFTNDTFSSLADDWGVQTPPTERGVTSDAGQSTVKVTCPQDAKAQVQEILRNALSGMEGVSVQ